ncbi:nucleotide sugar dehydrogenase [Parasphingopyxis lamellibrachiae]|uniref:UDP-N-acetyl-D-galactosamine dehydrogenase n=1 Tax=Parasphingopyxis lamellibrachiae TaxID=680125 RepID=A0A3D9FE03_9SPHN|nr:nucleotide sugar dehydrogenase [Parasphingopyxis lamellibrachiae]RED16019.1 UDP-N-acetyl-D-galactosamine dehydrogenase [Parasphingopyxis lamellibrachiae]
MNAAPDTRIAVIGLGYVGLPLAVALARHFQVIGIDVSATRIEELDAGHDRTGEIDTEALRASSLRLTSDPAAAHGADIFVIAVPTPVDADKKPDLSALLSASRIVAPLLDAAKRPVIVYESTVYPGVTEDICGPTLEAASGLKRGADFFLGYSPERINPGDREHSIDKIVKVVAGENSDVSNKLAAVYGTITEAGAFKAASIKAAEAAKVIENAQRDINIAFMNEIARVFGPLGLSTWDVLEAARTKWNFLPFQPGLVGGHCIGVDPYYLSHCAEQLGHDPQVILAGRKINDAMGVWVADQLHERRGGKSGSVLVLGLTFKEDVPDLRNSRVIDVIARLRALGHDIHVHDPLANREEALAEYGVELESGPPAGPHDMVFAAVPHQSYRDMTDASIAALVKNGGLLADLKGMWQSRDLGDLARWTL